MSASTKELGYPAEEIIGSRALMGSEEIVRRKILNIQNGMDTCDYSVAFVMRFGYALLILVGKMVYKILIYVCIIMQIAIYLYQYL